MSAFAKQSTTGVDYDVASAPNPGDIEVDGKAIKAIAQSPNSVHLRVYQENRWPIEERPVAQSDIPGERLHPTQPFPTKPAPFDRQGISEDDLIDFTPEIAEAAREMPRSMLGPIFTPPIVRGSNGKRSTFVVPGAGGGANFPGATVDPETGIIYIPSATLPHGMDQLLLRRDSDWPYIIHGHQD